MRNQIFENDLEKSGNQKNLEEKIYYQICVIIMMIIVDIRDLKLIQKIPETEKILKKKISDYFCDNNNFWNQRFEIYPEKSRKNPEYR